MQMYQAENTRLALERTRRAKRNSAAAGDRFIDVGSMKLFRRCAR
jgi:hypothetical protein